MTKNHPTFFILGVHRSGTTLLEQMLDAHSQMAVCREISSGKILWRLNSDRMIKDEWKALLALNHFYQRTKILTDPIAGCFARQAIRAISYPIKTQDWYALIMTDYLQQKQARIFGEKTPDNSFFVSTIDRVFPDSKYIVILRNPFDIVLSLCEIAILKLKVPITDALLLRFAELVKRGLHDLYEKKTLSEKEQLWIRYEDLILEADETLSEICHFLEVEYEAGMKKFQHRKKFTANQEIMKKVLGRLDQPLTDQRINRSFSTLSTEQLNMLQQYLAPQLSHLPYQFSLPAATLPLQTKWKIFRAKTRFFFRLYMLEEQKDKLRFQIHYLAIRFLRNTPLRNYIFKRLIYKKEAWENILAQKNTDADA